MDDRLSSRSAGTCGIHTRFRAGLRQALPVLVVALAALLPGQGASADEVPGPFRLDVHWGPWQPSHRAAADGGRGYPAVEPEICWDFGFPMNLEFHPRSLPELEGCLYRNVTRLQEKVCATGEHHPYWQAELRSMEIVPAPGQVLDLTNEAAPGEPPDPVGCRAPRPWELLAERNRGRERGMCLLGNPINPASGNKFQAELDYTGAGAHPVRWERYYNSDTRAAMADPPGQSLGAGWSHAYNGSLWRYRVGTDFHLMAFRPDGRAYRYRWDHALQDYVGPSDVADRFVRQDNGEWGFRNADGTVEIYGYTSGDRTWLTELRYPDGHRVRVNRAGAGEILSVEDHLGRALTVSTADGRIAALTDPAGHVVTYAYDAPAGRAATLVSVTYPGATPAVRQYLYGEPAHVGGSQHDYMKLTGIVDENGDRYATWKYGADGRAWHAEHAGGAGAVTLGAHAPPDGPAPYLGSVSFTDANGATEVQTFEVLNGHAKMSAVMNGQCAHCAGRPKAVTYDARGFVATRQDAGGNLAFFRHDAFGNETCRLEGVPGSGDPADNALTVVHTEWHPEYRVATRVRVFEPLDPSMPAPLACDASASPPGWVLRRETETRLVAGTSRIDSRTERSFPEDPATPPRTTDFIYYGEAPGDDPALAALGLLHAIDGPRTDVADVTRFYHATSDGPGRLTGDLERVVDAAGNVVLVTRRDALGRPVETADANGAVTALEYHPRGWLTSSTTAASTAAAATTTFEYDAVGQVRRVSLPGGATLDYAWDAAHRLVRLSDGAGAAVAFDLDPYGNHVAERTTDAAGDIVREVRRVYDALNRLALVIGGEGQTAAFRYDGNGNRVTSIDPRDPDPGNAHAVVATRALYDALNRVRATVDAEGALTRYERDAAGALVRAVAPGGIETVYERNGFGEVVVEHSPDAGTTRVAYDGAGNRVQRTDARGVVVGYVYDTLNRLTRVDFPADVDTVLTYDEAGAGVDCATPRHGRGRLTSMTDESGTTAWFYDARGNVVCKERTLAGKRYVMRYAYDSADRLTEMTWPSGRRVRYERNAQGQVSRMSMTDSTGTTTLLDDVRHAPFGPPVGWRFGNGLAVDMPLDRSYRVAAIAHGDALARTWHYDPADNPVGVTDAVDPAASEAFTYDWNSRLTSASGPYGDLAFDYDANGNRTRLTVDGNPGHADSSTYAYAPGTNRLLTNTAGAPARSYERAYDAAGNVIARTPAAPGRAFEYIYGDDGRLAATVLAHPRRPTLDRSLLILKSGFGRPAVERHRRGPVGSTRYAVTLSRFVYDEAGRLVAVYDGRRAYTDYIYLGDRLVALATGPNRISHYEPDPEVPGRRIAVPVEQPVFVQTDALGAPIYASNPDGETVWQPVYRKPFGARSVAGNRWPDVRLGLPGQIHSSYGWTVYNHFREYDPVAGRYLQSDPVGLQGGLNTYAYANNNPLRFTDSFGLRPYDFTLGFGGGVGHMIVGGGVYTATITDATTDEQCSYQIRCVGLGVGLPEIGVAGSPVRFDDGRNCSSCRDFEGTGYIGGGSVVISKGANIGGGIKIPDGPFIAGDFVSPARGSVNIGVSHNVCYFRLLD